MYRSSSSTHCLNFYLTQRSRGSCRRICGGQRRQPEIRQLALQCLRLFLLYLAHGGFLSLALKPLDRRGIELKFTFCSPAYNRQASIEQVSNLNTFSSRSTLSIDVSWSYRQTELGFLKFKQYAFASHLSRPCFLYFMFFLPSIKLFFLALDVLFLCH